MGGRGKPLWLPLVGANPVALVEKGKIEKRKLAMPNSRFPIQSFITLL